MRYCLTAYCLVAAAAVLLTGCSATATDKAASPQNTAAASETAPVPTPRVLSEEEIKMRDETEARMLKGEFLHDGSGVLQRVGDINSVPALLMVLKKEPPRQSKNGSTSMVCTTGHALAALRTLTGANPGITYEEWKTWWDEYDKTHPGTRR